MKASIAVLAGLLAVAPFAVAQGGGSGESSPLGQSITPQAASGAERAVEARHEKAQARAKARAARHAMKAASAASQ